MLSKYESLLLIEHEEFDSYREEYFLLKEGLATDVDKTTKGIFNIIKKLHSSSDDRLIENMPDFSRLLTRCIIIGSIAVISPVIGLITLYTSSAIRRRNDANRREKLIHLYSSKLEYIEDRLTRESDEKKRQNMIKMKNKLKSDLDKLKVIKD
ncbi:hypothetical protein INTERNEXUS_298 [Bacillus phage vB_BspM_Internexus]|nr:hypothetical protein INTERNEXUS_298 [Bacillus phage vB_BspM_Internexus]